MTLPFRTCVTLLALAGLAAGCSSVPYDAAGETVAVFQFGEFKMLLNTTAPKATAAAVQSLRQLDLYQTENVANRFDARLVARARNDQKVVVKIEEVNSKQTLVRIRWGEGGDKTLSKRLFDTIEANVR